MTPPPLPLPPEQCSKSTCLFPKQAPALDAHFLLCFQYYREIPVTVSRPAVKVHQRRDCSLLDRYWWGEHCSLTAWKGDFCGWRLLRSRLPAWHWMLSSCQLQVSVVLTDLLTAFCCCCCFLYVRKGEWRTSYWWVNNSQGSQGPYRCLQVLTNWICQVRPYKSL